MFISVFDTIMQLQLARKLPGPDANLQLVLASWQRPPWTTELNTDTRVHSPICFSLTIKFAYVSLGPHQLMKQHRGEVEHITRCPNNLSDNVDKSKTCRWRLEYHHLWLSCGIHSGSSSFLVCIPPVLTSSCQSALSERRHVNITAVGFLLHPT